jgi:Uncharacterised nucleotidyltransferase
MPANGADQLNRGWRKGIIQAAMKSSAGSVSTISGAQRHVISRLALDPLLADVVRAFAQRGICPVLLKGPVFAQWLYDDPTERSYGDVDLLVAPAEFEAARRTLASLGFSRWQPPVYAREYPAHHDVWCDGTNPNLQVELHRTLFLTTAPDSVVWQRVTEDATTLEIAGVRVAVPGEAANALIVGLHAAHHGVERSKSLRDLERAVERVDAGTWRRAAALARELGAGPAFATGLGLAPGGGDLASRLGLDASAAPRSVRLRASAPRGAATTIEWLVDQLEAADGAGSRARLLAQLLFPARGWMLAGYPLARRGRLGLVGAYGLRLIRVAMMIPSGAREWARIARRPRTDQHP